MVECDPIPAHATSQVSSKLIDSDADLERFHEHVTERHASFIVNMDVVSSKR